MKGVGAQRTASGVSSFFFRVLLTLLAINFTTIAALIYIAYSFSTESLTQQAEDNIAQQVNILADKFDKEYRKPLNRSLRNLINAPLLDDYLLGSKGGRGSSRCRLPSRIRPSRGTGRGTKPGEITPGTVRCQAISGPRGHGRTQRPPQVGTTATARSCEFLAPGRQIW